MRLLVLVTFLVLTSGCATSAKYGEVLNSWTGSNINELTNSWGYPSSSFQAPNGNTVYVYSEGSSITMPTTYQTNANAYGYGNSAYGSATTNVYGGQTINYWCKTYFEVNQSKIIVHWRTEGNRCVSK